LWVSLEPAGRALDTGVLTFLNSQGSTLSSVGDRAYVAHMLDYRDAQLDRARAEMDRRVSELRDEWSAGVAHQVAAAESATRQRQEARIEWLRSLTGDDVTKDVAGAGGLGVGTSASTGTPVGHNPQPEQPTQPDPWAAELAEAERIRSMPMGLWAEERQRLVRPNQGMF
jgi:hypothetical protein